MRDVDAQLGETVAALVRAGRVLHPEWLAVLLENVSCETEAALLEHDARMRGARRRPSVPGSVIAFPGRPPGEAPPREPTGGAA
ncbi:MAG: hypothetical protein INR70_10560 [Parafilimonas terrae]|nr:hypothetical protein [Parafilimonas terrae]